MNRLISPIRLHRRGRLIRNLVCVPLLLILCWRLLGSPAFSPVHRFRQTERQYLAGPSEVAAVIGGDELALLEENVENYPNTAGIFSQYSPLTVMMEEAEWFVVGKTGEGWLCSYQRSLMGDPFWEPLRSYLSVVEKTGETTAKALAGHFFEGSYVCGIFFVQTDLPGAQRIYLEAERVVGTEKKGFSLNRCSGSGAVHEEGISIVPVSQCADPVDVGAGTEGEYVLYLTVFDGRGNVIGEETLTV